MLLLLLLPLLLECIMEGVGVGVLGVNLPTASTPATLTMGVLGLLSLGPDATTRGGDVLPSPWAWSGAMAANARGLM